MFAFDHWADWLKSRTNELECDGYTTTYRDTRTNPECASNPAFGLDVETPNRLGSISFWRNGLCDFQVLDTSTKELVADERMLDANDQTVSTLLSRFVSFFGHQSS